MNIYAIIGAAAIGFLAAWTAQGWRYGEQIESIKLAQSEAARKAFESAQRENERLQAQKDEALNEANKRAQKNAALARELDSDVDRLRQTIRAGVSGLPQASCDAARNYAAAIADVYGSCVKEYSSLAKTLDGALSDLKTIEDAWPK